MPAAPAEPDDVELMRRTAAGDRDAFAAVYRRHQGAIFRFARLMTGSAAAAEDIVQEVFLVLMRSPLRYDPARASLSTYLYGIARRHTRRRLSRERRFVALETRDAKETTAAAGVDTELAREREMQQLRRAILTLPSRYREVIVLCDLQDLTYVEAAATLSCPVGTVRSRLSRARVLLIARMTRAAAAAPRAGHDAAGRPGMRCAV